MTRMSAIRSKREGAPRLAVLQAVRVVDMVWGTTNDRVPETLERPGVWHKSCVRRNRQGPKKWPPSPSRRARAAQSPGRPTVQGLLRNK
jgi:hypothetical protein